MSTRSYSALLRKKQGVQGDLEDVDSVPLVRVSSQHELEEHVQRLARALRDTKSLEWTKRMDELRTLRGILLGGDVDKHSKWFAAQFNMHLKIPMGEQVVDRRSQVVKETCLILEEVARQFGGAVEETAHYVVEKLLKQSVVSTAALSQPAHKCVFVILENVQRPHVLEKVLQGTKDKRDKILRMCCADYMLQVLLEWQSKRVLKISDELNTYIRAALSDALSEVRQKARQAFWLLREHWADGANEIYVDADESVQKLVEEEITRQETKNMVRYLRKLKKSSKHRRSASFMVERHNSFAAGVSPQSTPRSRSRADSSDGSNSMATGDGTARPASRNRRRKKSGGLRRDRSGTSNGAGKHGDTRGSKGKGGSTSSSSNGGSGGGGDATSSHSRSSTPVGEGSAGDALKSAIADAEQRKRESALVAKYRREKRGSSARRRARGGTGDDEELAREMQEDMDALGVTKMKRSLATQRNKSLALLDAMTGGSNMESLDDVSLDALRKSFKFLPTAT